MELDALRRGQITKIGKGKEKHKTFVMKIEKIDFFSSKAGYTLTENY